jgi:hypothetical protein
MNIFQNAGWAPSCSYIIHHRRWFSLHSWSLPGTIRYGIIGAGMMGQEHINNINLLKEKGGNVSVRSLSTSNMCGPLLIAPALFIRWPCSASLTKEWWTEPPNSVQVMSEYTTTIKKQVIEYQFTSALFWNGIHAPCVWFTTSICKETMCGEVRQGCRLN